ncbi:MAG: hypothetical protein U0401_32295 [Anaerolineae bacterium]
MSCENNINQAGQAVTRSGISTTASKSGYSAGAIIGKGGGAIAGFGVGFGVGSLIAPGLGSMAGGLAGAYMGYKAGGELADKVAHKMRERAAQAALERTWKVSPSGQKAITTRNERLRAAKATYNEAMSGIKPKEMGIKQTYEKTRSQWLKANSGTSAIREGDLGKAFTSPEARTALGGLVEGALRVTDQAVRDQRMSSITEGVYIPPGPGDRVAKEVLSQTAQYKTRLAAAREQAWLSSLEGQTAKENYDQGMAQVKVAKQVASGKYAAAKESIETRYNTVRTKFLDQLQQQTVSDTSATT